MKPLIIVAVICVRYLILPLVGICLVKGADNLGLLPSDPLFHFVLMIQFALPPAMNIGKSLYRLSSQIFSVIQDFE